MVVFDNGSEKEIFLLKIRDDDEGNTAQHNAAKRNAKAMHFKTKYKWKVPRNCCALRCLLMYSPKSCPGDSGDGRDGEHCGGEDGEGGDSARGRCGARNGGGGARDGRRIVAMASGGDVYS